MTAKFKIVDETGRQVAHLKRVRFNGKIDVTVWFDGDTFWPTSRGYHTPKPFKLEGSASYDERTARSWIKSLERTGFKMVER